MLHRFPSGIGIVSPEPYLRQMRLIPSKKSVVPQFEIIYQS
jgi:hypothetical protein